MINFFNHVNNRTYSDDGCWFVDVDIEVNDNWVQFVENRYRIQQMGPEIKNKSFDMELHYNANFHAI